MDSLPQDFTAWCQLLPLHPHATIGFISEPHRQSANTIQALGARTERWVRESQDRYDGVIVMQGNDTPAIKEVAATISDGGFLWIWNGSRGESNDLARMGFEVRLLVALPSTERPRFIFDPIAGRRLILNVLRLHASSSIRIRVAKKIYASLAGWLAKLRLGPPVIVFAKRPKNDVELPPGISAWTYMKREIPALANATVLGASPGIGQKGVIAGSDSNGKFIAFSKFADQEHHGTFLRNESEILMSFETAFGNANLEVPKVLTQEYGDSYAQLVLKAIDGTKLSSPEHLPKDLAESMGRLFYETAKSGHSMSSKGTLSDWLETLLADHTDDGLILDAIEMVRTQLGESSPPLGLSHRDFVFWNVINTGSRWAVIDWEWANSKHIPFQDVFHFYLHGRVNTANQSPLEALSISNTSDWKQSIANYANNAKVSENLAPVMFTLYLCDWLRIQNQIGLSRTSQTSGYRELLQAVVDGKAGI